MAECLTDKTIHIEEFFCIYVKSERVRNEVIRILRGNSAVFPENNIYVREIWFNL